MQLLVSSAFVCAAVQTRVPSIYDCEVALALDPLEFLRLNLLRSWDEADNDITLVDMIKYVRTGVMKDHCPQFSAAALNVSV